MKKIQIFAAVALVAAMLSGCAQVETQSSVAPDSGVGMSKEIGGASGMLASDAIAAADRSVIKTGSVSFETPEIGDVQAAINDIVANNNGLVESWSQESNNQGELWAVNATVRVEAAKLDATISALGDLGKVLSTNVNSTDVTTQVLDIDARVKSLAATVGRLEKLMAEAKSTADLLAAESALAQRQAELDSLVQQQKYLKDSVDMATLNVSAFAEGRGPIAAPTSFIDGIEQGWKALLAFFGGTVVFLGMATPWLLILLPIAAIAFVIVRRLIVRSKRQI
jgi:PBP1b-binding outer membrane lipoprotein LpoB